MRKLIERAADSALSRLVPRGTAAASCFVQNYCTSVRCDASSGRRYRTYIMFDCSTYSVCDAC